MINNAKRIARFTSSEIYRLMSKGKKTGEFGKPFYSYVEEKRMELRLGRSLNSDKSARPTEWGKACEQVAFDLLGLEYSITSTETIVHSEVVFWAGSPDGENEDTVIDIKCPYTLKSFCTFADCKDINDIREKHDDGEKYYWQLVSNSVLCNKKFAELVVYCPFKSELSKVREYCELSDNPNKVAWIHFAEDSDLPYLPDGCWYSNLYIFRFEVPESDKQELEYRVKKAGELLIK